MKITPCDNAGSHRKGSLVNITAQGISKILGFKPNVEDDPDKVVNSWAFKAEGKKCAIWDYKGSHLDQMFSTYGDSSTLKKIFGSTYISER